jgi:tRNA splicing endonuclease
MTTENGPLSILSINQYELHDLKDTAQLNNKSFNCSGPEKFQDTHCNCKQLVFDNLTKDKKMYVTDALKFGGDFLVYQGDPDLFHAKYMVVVTNKGII